MDFTVVYTAKEWSLCVAREMHWVCAPRLLQAINRQLSLQAFSCNF
jgi:hypothetical protein